MARGLDAEDNQFLTTSNLVLLEKHPRFEAGGHSHPQGIIRVPAVTVVGSVGGLSPGGGAVPDEFSGPGRRYFLLKYTVQVFSKSVSFWPVRLHH